MKLIFENWRRFAEEAGDYAAKGALMAKQRREAEDAEEEAAETYQTGMGKQFGIKDPEAEQKPVALSPDSVEDLFVSNAGARVPAYVDMLKKIASHPTFQKIAQAGRTDAKGPEDEMFKVAPDTLKAKELHSTQAEIGFGNSIDDLLNIPGWSYKNAKKSGEPAKNPAENALGLAAKKQQDPNTGAVPPIEMLCPDVRCAIFTFGPVDGKYRILDGHHRWSQVMMMNPDATVSVDNLEPKAPLDSIDNALKLIQLAVAINAKKVITKPFVGKNLMMTEKTEVYNYVVQNVSDTTLQLMVDAGKIAEPKAELAAEFMSNNLAAIQANKGRAEFTRGGVMPQPADAGTSQKAVADILNTGVVNFDNPRPEDAEAEPESPEDTEGEVEPESDEDVPEEEEEEQALVEARWRKIIFK